MIIKRASTCGTLSFGDSEKELKDFIWWKDEEDIKI